MRAKQRKINWKSNSISTSLDLMIVFKIVVQMFSMIYQSAIENGMRMRWPIVLSFRALSAGLLESEMSSFPNHPSFPKYYIHIRITAWFDRMHTLCTQNTNNGITFTKFFIATQYSKHWRSGWWAHGLWNITMYWIPGVNVTAIRSLPGLICHSDVRATVLDNVI